MFAPGGETLTAIGPAVASPVPPIAGAAVSEKVMVTGCADEFSGTTTAGHVRSWLVHAMVLGSPATAGLEERVHEEAPLTLAEKKTSPPPELNVDGVTVKLEIVGATDAA
jgi:hypothetical protein